MTRYLLAIPVLLALSCENEPRGRGYHATLDDAGGLKPGADVFVAGVQAGRVNQVQLDGTKARVEFDLRAEGVKVTTNTCVGVAWYPGKEAHLKVEPGAAQGAEIAPGGEISCVQQDSPENLKSIAAKSNQVLDAVLDGPGVISRLLKDRAMLARLERFLDSPPATPPALASGDAAPSATNVPGASGSTSPTSPKPEPRPAAPKPASAPRPAPAPKPAPKPPPSDLINPF
ncbi:MAG: MlaD family protein [Polyangiaceae bacterium]